jgi:hypothetical protein
MQTEPTSLKVENVDDFMRCLEQRRASNRTVVLDLQRIRSVERPAASILSAALLSAWGEAPLVVCLPHEDEQLRKAALSTLAFAFANRRGDTQGVGNLSAWKRSWSPGTRNQVRLFSPAQIGESESDDEPSIFGRHHAAFINPHRAAPSPGPTSVTQVVRPWLTHVLPSYISAPRDLRAHPQFIQDVGRLIDETLENVREHASGQTSGASTRSLIQVDITRGGEGSYDRLHVIVLDTGPGIAATARPKLENVRLSDAELVKALLIGDFAGWHRARGAGLPKVWKAVSAWRGAALQIASNTVRVTGTGSNLKTREDGFHVHGTVIAAMFPLPAVALH